CSCFWGYWQILSVVVAVGAFFKILERVIPVSLFCIIGGATLSVRSLPPLATPLVYFHSPLYEPQLFEMPVPPSRQITCDYSRLMVFPAVTRAFFQKHL